MLLSALLRSTKTGVKEEIKRAGELGYMCANPFKSYIIPLSLSPGGKWTQAKVRSTGGSVNDSDVLTL